jgi:hypothetical protein
LLAGFLRLPTVILQASYMQWLVGHYGNVAGSSSNVVYTIGPVGSAALDCVQSAIAAMYGLQVDVDNTHWRLFGGREGTTPHVSVVSCGWLLMPSATLDADVGGTKELGVALTQLFL